MKYEQFMSVPSLSIEYRALFGTVNFFMAGWIRMVFHIDRNFENSKQLIGCNVFGIFEFHCNKFYVQYLKF